MVKTATLSSPQYIHAYDALAGVWLTRIVINNPIAMKHLCSGMYAEELRMLIGISPTEGNLPITVMQALVEELARRADDIELKSQLNLLRPALSLNLTLLSGLLELDDCQQGLLAFAALCQHHMLLHEVLEQFNSHSCHEMTSAVAMAINCPLDAVLSALNGHTGLINRRLVSLGSDFSDSNLQLKLNPDLYKVIFSHHNDIAELMASFIEEAVPTKLARVDFKHLEAETEVLESYLTNASSESLGLNLLIYGPTGSGKTEYVKWLSAQLGKKLYQVKSEDKDTRPITGVGRLAFFQFSQQFLKHANAMLVFDEIEDIFPNGDGKDGMFYQDTNKVGKAWLNNTLETNPVPTIWISNSIGQIDKAYLRRFDFSVEIGIPQMSIRKRILKKYLGPLEISTKTIDEYAQHTWLSPAQIERAAKVLKSSKTPLQDREAKLALLLNNSMNLLRQLPVGKIPAGVSQHFDSTYINSGDDLNILLAALIANSHQAATLCFHGEPGTGKTSLAYYIAKQLQRPLIVRTAAQLLSAYLGETEQNMADAFKLAERDNAILLIDEADSFLSSRQLAIRSWEVTQINQMLRLIDTFNGILICSTNRMDSLDEASLRRFTYKIKFDLMTSEQRWMMFKEALHKIPTTKLLVYRAQVDGLNGLSLGDFATVRKKSELSVKPFGPEQWLASLKIELQYKQASQKQRIGFLP